MSIECPLLEDGCTGSGLVEPDSDRAFHGHDDHIVYPIAVYILTAIRTTGVVELRRVFATKSPLNSYALKRWLTSKGFDAAGKKLYEYRVPKQTDPKYYCYDTRLVRKAYLKKQELFVGGDIVFVCSSVKNLWQYIMEYPYRI